MVVASSALTDRTSAPVSLLSYAATLRCCAAALCGCGASLRSPVKRLVSDVPPNQPFSSQINSSPNGQVSFTVSSNGQHVSTTNSLSANWNNAQMHFQAGCYHQGDTARNLAPGKARSLTITLPPRTPRPADRRPTTINSAGCGTAVRRACATRTGSANSSFTTGSWPYQVLYKGAGDGLARGNHRIHGGSVDAGSACNGLACGGEQLLVGNAAAVG